MNVHTKLVCPLIAGMFKYAAINVKVYTGSDTLKKVHMPCQFFKEPFILDPTELMYFSLVIELK